MKHDWSSMNYEQKENFICTDLKKKSYVNKSTKADICISIFPVMAESLLFYHQWPILSEGKSAYANTDVD